MKQFSSISDGLRQLREQTDITPNDLANRLIVGPGWVELVESGDFELPTSLLVHWLAELGSDLASFLPRVDLDSETAYVRGLAAEPDGDDLVLHFRFGRHPASYRMAGTSSGGFDDFLTSFRNKLAAASKRDAVAQSFLDAAARWPQINPSDIWYFIVGQAYLDRFNHPASEARTDLSQSWKRTAGWALERLLVDYYNQHLKKLGVQLELPDSHRKQTLLSPLALGADAKPEKADVIAVGTLPNGDEHCFGVIHVKASFAERRNADVALSRALLQRGYVSSFVTMDSKAIPSEMPVNRGELGPALTENSEDVRGPKRREIEVERNFDACFSYNRNTTPTPPEQDAAARIFVCDFANPDDAFSAHLVAGWRARRGGA